MVFIDYYKTLGLPFDASGEAVKAAFRNLAKKFHPDVIGADDFPEERYKDIQEAYKVLSDPKLRKQYNQAHHRFSKHAYAVGNKLIGPSQRNSNHLYSWHPAYRPSKSLLNKRQSLFLGLFVVFVSVAFAVIFYGVNKKRKPALEEAFTDTPAQQPAPPVATKSLPSPKEKPIVNEPVAAANTADKQVSRIDIPAQALPAEKRLIATQISPLQISEHPASKPGLASGTVIPTIPVLPVHRAADETPPTAASPAPTQQYGYAVFRVKRILHSTGKPDEIRTSIYLSGIALVDTASQEDQAKIMLDAEINCSARESKFASSLTTGKRSYSYRVESRKLKTFRTEAAALSSLRGDQQFIALSAQPQAQQYGYLVFVVRRKIRHNSTGNEDTQMITYITNIMPYTVLSPQLKAQVIVNGEVQCSQAESRYATTHSAKKDAISYNIISRNLKTFKTEEEAMGSLRNESPYLVLK